MKKKFVSILISCIFLSSSFLIIGCNKEQPSKEQESISSNNEIKENKDEEKSIEENKNNADNLKEKESNTNLEKENNKEDIKKESKEDKEEASKSNKKDNVIDNSKDKGEDNSSNNTKKSEEKNQLSKEETNKNKENSEEENLKINYEKADNELNELWHRIVSYGADYPDLIESQEKWINYKDSKDLATKTKLTKERIETLQKWFSYQRRIQGRDGYQFAQNNPCPSLDWN